MGLSLFRVQKGFSIGGVAWIAATGAPGASGDSSTVVRGSLYLDTASGNIWVKTGDGSGTDKWIRAQDSHDLSTAINSLPWKTPVRVCDQTTYADVSAATTALNAHGKVDNYSVVANDKILYTGIPGTIKIYTVSGTPGTDATLVQDLSVPEEGDFVFVLKGDVNSSKLFYYYNGSYTWIGAEDAAELANLRNYVGKTDVSTGMPSYLSTINISANDDLTKAVGSLDYKVGNLPAGAYTSTNSVATSLGVLNAALELERTVAFGVLISASNPALVDEVTATSGSVGCTQWDVLVQQTGNLSNASLLRVTCLDNGTDSTFAVHSVLSIGSAIPNVVISTAIGSGKVQLYASADIAVTASIVRKNLTAFATVGGSYTGNGTGSVSKLNIGGMVGVFAGTADPTTIDTSDYPVGSIYLQTTGSLWQRVTIDSNGWVQTQTINNNPNVPQSIYDNMLSVVAGTDLLASHAVQLDSNGHAVYADSSDLSTIGHLFGVTMTSVSSGQKVMIRIGGEMIDSSWTWNTGGSVFLGTNGVLTQTIPTTGYSQVIGKPLSATSLFLNFQTAIKIAS